MNLAIIPARGGSERIHKKNIVDFCGKPLIYYSIEAARKSTCIDHIHVSTDCEEIASVVRDLGCEIDFMRPSHLADSQTGVLPVANWVLDQFSKQDKVFDNVFLVMPTAPLINHIDIENTFELFKKYNRKYPAFTCAKFPVVPQWAFGYIESEGLMSPIIPDNLNLRSQDLEKFYYDTGSFSIVSKEHIQKGIGDIYVPYILPQERAVDIDEFEDLRYAKILYKGLSAEEE